MLLPWRIRSGRLTCRCFRRSITWSKEGEQPHGVLLGSVQVPSGIQAQALYGGCASFWSAGEMSRQLALWRFGPELIKNAHFSVPASECANGPNTCSICKPPPDAVVPCVEHCQIPTCSLFHHHHHTHICVTCHACSTAWLAIRKGRLTASALCNLLGWFNRRNSLPNQIRLWRDIVGIEKTTYPESGGQPCKMHVVCADSCLCCYKHDI